MSSLVNEHTLFSKEQITIIGISGIKVQVPLPDKSTGFVKQLLPA